MIALRIHVTAALALGTALLLGAPTVTQAASVLESQNHAGGLAIPDDGYAGPLGDGSYAGGSVAQSTITVDPLGEDIITGLSVTVAMEHAYIGDLTLKLRGPDGTTVFLLDRPGLAGNPDNGVDGGGYSANLSTDHPITFDDDAVLPSEYMGIFYPNDHDIVGSVAGTDEYFPYSDTVHNFGALGDFNGKSIVGDWKLILGDSTLQETGKLYDWTLSATTTAVTSVPTPGAATAGLLLMSGIAGTGLLRRGRRDKR